MVFTWMRILSIGVVGAILVGCAATVPMTREAASAIKNREVIIAKRDKPDFLAGSPGKAMFGMVGLGVMINTGNALVAKCNIEDPAIYIAERLGGELAAKYGTTVSSESMTLVDDDVQAIAKSNPSADLVLDVRTTNWLFAYFPTNWERYRVMYSARLRLIDAKGRKVIAEGGCPRYPQETPSSPTYDELLADNAARLKKELQDAAEFCVGEFKSKILQVE